MLVAIDTGSRRPVKILRARPTRHFLFLLALPLRQEVRPPGRPAHDRVLRLRADGGAARAAGPARRGQRPRCHQARGQRVSREGGFPGEVRPAPCRRLEGGAADRTRPREAAIVEVNA